jgi:hypothetical protein
MKSLLVRKEELPRQQFKVGDLLVSKTDNDLIILVTSVPQNGLSLGGVVIVKGASICAVGAYDKSWATSTFTLFHGEIKLTQ